MITEWMLVITVAAGAWGNVAGSSHTFPDKESCYVALAKMKIAETM